jgi:hypothetical protein
VAVANATGIRVLQSIVAAVPVRLMKRDLLFVAEQLFPLLDEKRLEMVARNRSIKAKEPELMIGYDPHGAISGGVCSLCGEKMLNPDPSCSDTRDAISAFSIAFGYHIRLKHHEFVPN